MEFMHRTLVPEWPACAVNTHALSAGRRHAVTSQGWAQGWVNQAFIPGGVHHLLGGTNKMLNHKYIIKDNS